MNSQDECVSLHIDRLGVSVETPWGVKTVLREVSFQVKTEEWVGIVGRSGVGKSLTGSAILGLLSAPQWQLLGNIFLRRSQAVIPEHVSDSVSFGASDSPLQDLERDVFLLQQGQYCQQNLQIFRSRYLAAVFQDPASYLHPTLSVGWQMREALGGSSLTHNDQVSARLTEHLAKVKLIKSGILKQYAHEFSQGQQQRLLIAMAVLRPAFLIADEPTSSLDPTTERGIIDLFLQLRESHLLRGGIIISHNYRTLQQLLRPKERILLLNQGQDGVATLHQEQTVESFFRQAHSQFVFPQHTSQGMRQTRRLGNPALLPSSSFLKVENLWQSYSSGLFRPPCHVLRGVSFSVSAAEIFGLVGESGEGKSTLAKAILRLLDHTRGQVIFRGDDLIKIHPHGLRADPPKMAALRRQIQLIFQDSSSTFNERMTIGETLQETVRLKDPSSTNKETDQLIKSELIRYGLATSDDWQHVLTRYPHELSGGQRQRLAIVRVLLFRPALIIADEPFANQDPITTEELCQDIRQIRSEQGTAFLIISHDVELLARLCDRIGILHAGRIVSEGEPATVFRSGNTIVTRMMEALKNRNPVVTGTY